MLLLHHYQPLMAAAVAKFPSEPWVALGRRGGRAAPAAAFPRGGAARRRVPGRRLRHRGGRPRARGRPPGGARLRAARCARPTHPPRRPPSAPTPTRCAPRPTRSRPPRPRRATPSDRRGAHGTARRRPGARPRARGRRPVGNDDARRPRRRRHQGQPAARLLLDEHAHRDVLQPGQAQHRDEPEGSRRDGDPARAGRVGRRRAAQHALRRRGPPGRRLREPARDQARPDLLPHARLRARRTRRSPRATTRPARRSPVPTGSTAVSTTTASRSGPSCRWATPATGSCRRSRSCRRSTTATAPAKDSSSTRRSCTRNCSTRRLRGASPTAAATATAPSSTRCNWVGTRRYRLYETADGWLCVAAVDDDHRAALAAALGVGAHHRRHRVRRARSPRSGCAAPSSGSPRSTPPACRARSRPPTSCSTCSTTRR